MKNIRLRKRLAIAPRGKQPGTFAETMQEVEHDASGQETRNDVVIEAALEAKDAKGNNYKIQKRYNLLGRGIKLFAKDFQAWSGRPLTEEELDGFDADALIKGKNAVFEIAHRKKGKETEAFIQEFLPAETNQEPKN